MPQSQYVKTNVRNMITIFFNFHDFYLLRKVFFLSFFFFFHFNVVRLKLSQLYTKRERNDFASVLACLVVCLFVLFHGLFVSCLVYCFLE